MNRHVLGVVSLRGDDESDLGVSDDDRAGFLSGAGLEVDDEAFEAGVGGELRLVEGGDVLRGLGPVVGEQIGEAGVLAAGGEAAPDLEILVADGVSGLAVAVGDPQDVRGVFEIGVIAGEGRGGGEGSL
jgi:hypothetical protein